MARDDEKAFPGPFQTTRSYVGEISYNEGMTLRDWFAGMAMMGKMSLGPVAGELDPSMGGIAAHCYKVADAMLFERKKSEEKAH